MVQDAVIHYVAPSDLETRRDEFSEREWGVLERVNQKVAAAEDLDAVMDFLFDTTVEVCPCDRVGLAFLEEETQRLVSHWNRASYDPVILEKGYSQALEKSSLRDVIESGRVRVINDLEAYLKENPNSNSTRIILKEGIRSNMTCPLSVDGRRVGVLFRSSKKPYAYGTHEVKMHVAVSERLGQAVEKAYRIEQLQAANAAYAEMLGFVSHELKGPVGLMVMQGRILHDGMVGELSEDQKDKVGRIIRKGEYLLGLIKDYLDLARVEGGALQVRPQGGVDVRGEVVEPALDQVREAVEERRMEVETIYSSDTLRWKLDPDLMKIVLVNLLSNAAKYGNEGGKLKITVQGEEGEGDLHLSVWNEGPGFSDAEKGSLFRRFSRLQKKELKNRKGTGVGLYTVYRIVRAHGGSIEAHSQEGSWAEFVLQLPR